MNEQIQNEDIKLGYLKEDYKIFHIKDKNDINYKPHYHDFNKIIIPLSYGTSYNVEGIIYKLNPGEILFIAQNQVHKPIIDKNNIYDRVVIWIKSNFKIENNNYSFLTEFFKEIYINKKNLIKVSDKYNNQLNLLINSLFTEKENKLFRSNEMYQSIFIQMLILINRLYKESVNLRINSLYNDDINKIIDVINNNLSENLSINELLRISLLNKYKLTNEFKKYTGYSLHNYIIEKRLIYSISLIKKGYQMNNISKMCGFKDYSGFVKSFKNKYKMSPKQYQTLIKI